MLRTSRGVALGATAALTVALLSALGGTAPAQAVYEPGEPDVAWGVQVPNDENEEYGDVGVSGDVVWVAGTHAVNGDLLHPMLARYDLAGHLLDRKVYDDGGGWNVTNIVLAAGDWGAVVAGGADGKTFLTRYQPDGTEVWSTDVSGVDGYVTPAAVTVEGDTIVTGSTVGGQFGNWRVDSFDFATGAHRLSRTMEGTGSLASLVAVDGEIVVGGLALGEMVPGQFVDGAGSSDAVLMALDPSDLSTTWAHQFGTPGDDWVNSLAVRDDTVYWGGTYGNDDDNPYSEAIGGVGAVAPDGTELWHRTTGHARVRSISATSEGLVIGGDAAPGQLGPEVVGHGVQDVFLQGRSFTGDALWTEVYGSSDWDNLSSLATVGDDTIYAVGSTGGTMFGDSHGEFYDAFAMGLQVPHLERPDLMVRPGARLVGDNHYGTDSPPVRIHLHRGDRRYVPVRLENDGLLGDRQLLRSCAGAWGGLRLRFRYGGSDVTSKIADGTFRTRRLQPGDAQRLVLAIDARAAKVGTRRCRLVSTSSTRGYEMDRLPIRVVVTRR